MTFKIIFITVAYLIAAMDIMFMILTMRQKDNTKKYFTGVCLSSALVIFFYIASAAISDKTLASTFSSLYFISMDALLLGLVAFVMSLGRNGISKYSRPLAWFIKIYGLFDVVIFIINIFHPFAIEYVRQNDIFAYYAYKMHTLYYMHLAYTYGMVAASIAILIIKALKVPVEYRKQYDFIFIGIIIIIAINAIFLFLPKERYWFQADYSIMFYSIVCFICYWAAYVYPKKGMLISFKNYIFENIDQGIILFNYDNRLIVSNDKAMKFLSVAKITDAMGINEFLNATGIKINLEDDAYSVQCYMKEHGKDRTLRCDYRKLHNRQNKIIGRLFVFADAQLDTDLLTGFHNWESFHKFAKENGRNYPDPTTIAVVDVNKMAVYNTIHGRTEGDQLLKRLSEKIRMIFPEDTYYVRGNDAYLIAVCYNRKEEDVIRNLTELEDSFEVKIQFAAAIANDEDTCITDTIRRAVSGLKAKKLLDKDSARSALISSLVRALQECDPDTEAHVERTRKMGTELGKRIGLSDVDLSKLSLLCLLHDIGKIGIPLEVLNKPGKLNDEEWILIKSHVTKGEAIAKSTPELADIAQAIRLHHERWDGKGYPDGISRESIPLLSRIISVVDAFDAMVNNRSYRRAMSIEDAKAEIRRCSGTQFDPYIATEFLGMLDEGYEVTTNSQNVVIPVVEVKKSEERAYNSKYIHPVNYARYILNSKDRIIAIDAGFTELTGYSEKDITEQEIHQSDLLPKEDLTEYACLVNEQLARNPQAYLEHRLLTKSGYIRYVYCLGRKYFDSAAREEKVEIIVTNATTTYTAKMLSSSMEKKAEHQLKQWEDTYRRDSLTGLLNHVSFVNDVEQMKISCPDLSYMFVMIDIDRFKNFNDTFGHHAGDEFLIVMAQTIRESIREKDLAARMGGDEFMLAVFLDKNEDYHEIADEIFNKISLKLATLKNTTTFSMGVALKDDSFKSFNALYEAADRGLYRSKDCGRNRVTFFSPDDLKENEENQK